MATTFRVDFRSGLHTLLDNFRTANPTLLLHTYRARPGSLHPPAAYVGPILEPRIDLTVGPTTRLIRAQVALVQGLYDNAETADRLDVLVDTFIQYVADHPHAINNRSVLVPTQAEDVELEMRGVDNKPSLFYAATLLTLESDFASPRLSA